MEFNADEPGGSERRVGWSRQAQEAREGAEARLATEAAAVGEVVNSAAARDAPELNLASLGRRFIGFFVDGAVIVAAVGVLVWLLPLSGDDWYWIGFLIGYLFFLSLPLFFAVILPLAFASSARLAGGSTPGKVLAGTAIRNASDGRIPGFRQFLNREFRRGGMIVLFMIPGVLDHVGALRDPLRQTWHDRGAGTVVIREPRGTAARGFVSLVATLVVFAAVFFMALAVTVGLVLVLL